MTANPVAQYDSYKSNNAGITIPVKKSPKSLEILCMLSISKMSKKEHLLQSLCSDLRNKYLDIVGIPNNIRDFVELL